MTYQPSRSFHLVASGHNVNNSWNKSKSIEYKHAKCKHVFPLTPNCFTTSGAARIRASMTSVEALLRMAVRSGSIPYGFLVVTASVHHSVIECRWKSGKFV
jgi:hypothetical protein